MTHEVLSHYIISMNHDYIIDLFVNRYDFSFWRLKDDPLNYLCLICGLKPLATESAVHMHYQDAHEVFIQQRICSICNEVCNELSVSPPNIHLQLLT